MDDEIRKIEPSPLETYPAWPDVNAEPVDVPMCKNPISDSVHWFDLLKLFIKESVITNILTMKGSTMNNDQKTTALSIATGIVSLVGLFGLNWPIEAVAGVISVGLMLVGYFTNKKDTPAQ